MLIIENEWNNKKKMFRWNFESQISRNLTYVLKVGEM